MKCQGRFVYKELVKKDGGQFTANDGRQINYKPSYLLKVDEVTDKGIYERTFKIPLESSLASELLEVKPYSDIILEFDVVIFGTNIRVIPTALIESAY